MTLSVGEQLGHYEITREIGRGGMGVVYLARDTKLDRNVALKVLPEVLARDKERVARFQQEAKVLASRCNASKPVGVMLRGHWYPKAELQAKIDALAEKYAKMKADQGEEDATKTKPNEKERK